MEQDLIITGLLRRRSEIAGSISHLEIQTDKLRSDLIHIDATLRILGHAGDEPNLPVRKACTSGIFHRKELPRTILILLRDNGGMTSPEVAEAISRDKGWDVNDKRFQSALTEKIGRALSKMRAGGQIAYDIEPHGYVWRLSGG